MRSSERLAAMAWRSSSASAGEKPATATAISMSCSWKSGTPERALQDRLESRVQVRHGLVTATASNVGVDGVALNGSGADERHFDDEVVEAARLHARQRRHLRARLDLKDAHGVGLAEQVVDRVLLGKRPQVDRRRRETPPPDRPRDATRRACPVRGDRTSPDRSPRSRPCPTAARCVRACVPTRPDTPLAPVGHRAPCPPNGCRGGVAGRSSSVAIAHHDRGDRRWSRASWCSDRRWSRNVFASSSL